MRDSELVLRLSVSPLSHPTYILKPRRLVQFRYSLKGHAQDAVLWVFAERLRHRRDWREVLLIGGNAGHGHAVGVNGAR